MPAALYAALAVAVLAILAYAVYSQGKAPVAAPAASSSPPGPAPPTCTPACGPGTSCALGGPGAPPYCAPAACEGPADCGNGGAGFACAGGACAPLLACGAAADCAADTGGPGGPCVEGFCLPPGAAGCSGDPMCPAGQSCSQPGPGGTCVAGAPPAGGACPAVACARGLVCNPATGACAPPPAGPPGCSPACTAPAVCASAEDPVTKRLVSSCVAPPTLPDRVCVSWSQPFRGSDTRNALATAYGGTGPFFFTWDVRGTKNGFPPTMSNTSTATTGNNGGYFGVSVTLAPYDPKKSQPTISVGNEMSGDAYYSWCGCSDGSACP